MFLPLFAPFLILKITRKHTKFPHLGTDFPIKNRLFYGIRSHFEDTYGNFRHNLSSGAKLTVYKEKKSGGGGRFGRQPPSSRGVFMVIFAVLWYNKYIMFSAQKRCEFSSRQTGERIIFRQRTKTAENFSRLYRKTAQNGKNTSSKPEKHPPKSGVKKRLYIIVYENHGEAHNEKL